MDIPINCPCPPTADGAIRHPAGDTVTLLNPLPFRKRIALRQTVRWAKEQMPDATDGELLAVLTEAYCLHCISAWTLVDEKGKAVPPSHAAIEAFLEEHDEQSLVVADAADVLYSPVVLLPLLKGASTSSPPTRTDAPTSPTKAGPTPLRKPSRRSSTSTTQTADTATTPRSPAGASRSSRSSASARRRGPTRRTTTRR